ncbi:MAG: hypothetical protein WD802_06205 [Gemmatimonadaceae bacterium]
MRPLLPLVIALATGACNLPGTVACTLEARAAVSVDVRDSVTNAAFGRGSTIIARDGAYADTAEITGVVDGPYGLAYERAGTYTVTVDQQGYRQWSRAGISVTKDECHVRGVSITARLQT